jgi:hypothetical protein
VPENVIATDDSDMSEDKSVNHVESVERRDMTDAEMEAEQREFDAEFGHIDYVPDEFDNEDEIDIEPLC